MEKLIILNYTIGQCVTYTLKPGDVTDNDYEGYIMETLKLSLNEIHWMVSEQPIIIN